MNNKSKTQLKIGVICSEFNKDLVKQLFDGAQKELVKKGFSISVIEWVPGSGEVPQASKWLIEKYKLDALIAFAAIIRGQTAHFESLCRILDQGLISLQMQFSLPIVFSVLMLENLSQAESRLGGDKGHRGMESSQALIKMIDLKRKLNGFS